MADEQTLATSETSVDDVEYRSLSPWAVIALVLGVASAVAFAGPLLLAIPVLGVFAAAIALWRVSAEGSELTGRRAALWGLALSVCFGVGAVADLVATRWRLESEATELTMAWFDHLQHGRLEAAHQLTLVPWRRRVGGDLAEYYRVQPEARADLEAFLAEKPTRAVLDLGKRGMVRPLRTTFIATDSRGRILVGRLYELRSDAQTEKRNVMLVVARRSEDDDTKAPRWEISRWKSEIKPSE
jgi:hypothetical protein